MVKISEIAKMPKNEKYDPQTMGYADFYGSLDDAKRLGRNKAISEISNIPIDKDKVMGMVDINTEALAKIFCNNFQTEGCDSSWEAAHVNFKNWCLDKAEKNRARKSEFLTIKGDV